MSVGYPGSSPHPVPLDWIWKIAGQELRLLQRPLIMGIVNVTPDSFSDGGQFFNADIAVEHGLKLIGQGADLLDIGGESTRPGAECVSIAEECRRVVPVVEALAKQSKVLLSIDTSKSAVADASLQAGAHIVNDVTAMTGDARMAEVVRQRRAGIILMHMQGTPKTMQQDPHYDNVIIDILAYLRERLNWAQAAGIEAEQIAVDPGIGFGKKSRHNLEILARIADFHALQRPICLGVSRKGFVGKLLGDRPPRERVIGSIAAACYAFAQQGAQLIRVHDVRETREARDVFLAIREAGVIKDGGTDS